MNGYREELYSTMFNALRHDVRRKILFLLSREDKSFTDLYETLGISSSYLTYHLDALDGLINKSHSAYALSSYGRTAVEIMKRVEYPYSSSKDSTKHYPIVHRERNLTKPLLGLLLTALLVVTGLYVSLHQIYASQIDTLEEKDNTIVTLYTELSAKKDYSELELISQRKPNTHITSYYTLSYYYSRVVDPQIPYKNSILVLYAPEDDLTLKLEFMCYLPDGMHLPVTVQDGVATKYDIGSKILSEEVIAHVYRECQSPVLGLKNVTNDDRELLLPLKAKGWYTISLVGPIIISQQSGAYVNYCWDDHDRWATTESAKLWANCQLLKNGEATLFVIDTSETANLKYIT